MGNENSKYMTGSQSLIILIVGLFMLILAAFVKYSFKTNTCKSMNGEKVDIWYEFKISLRFILAFM